MRYMPEMMHTILQREKIRFRFLEIDIQTATDIFLNTALLAYFGLSKKRLSAVFRKASVAGWISIFKILNAIFFIKQ